MEFVYSIKCSRLTSFHLFVPLLAAGGNILTKADHDLFFPRFKDARAAPTLVHKTFHLVQSSWRNAASVRSVNLIINSEGPRYSAPFAAYCTV